MIAVDVVAVVDQQYECDILYGIAIQLTSGFHIFYRL